MYPTKLNLGHLERFLDIHIKHELGWGKDGVAYLLDDGRVLKVTSSINELRCAELIFQDRLWERSAHLPKIYKVGQSPDGLRFIVREYLSDVSLDDMEWDHDVTTHALIMADEQDEELDEEDDEGIQKFISEWLMHLVFDEELRSIETIGFFPEDAHVIANWGKRHNPDGIYTTIVLRDVECRLAD